MSASYKKSAVFPWKVFTRPIKNDNSGIVYQGKAVIKRAKRTLTTFCPSIPAWNRFRGPFSTLNPRSSVQNCFELPYWQNTTLISFIYY